MQIYKQCVRPIFEYGSLSTITTSDYIISKIQRLQNKFIRLALRLPKYICTKLLYDSSGLPHVKDRLLSCDLPSPMDVNILCHHTPCLMMREVSLETWQKNIIIQDMINSENSINTTESTNTNIFKMFIVVKCRSHTKFDLRKIYEGYFQLT